MPFQITSAEALWFLPVILPICIWVMWSDLSAMKIRNSAVLALAAVFVIVGVLALPWSEYPWRLATMVAMLLAGIVLNAAGVMGAGDAKFIAAASPFIDPGDLLILGVIFAANLLACFSAHRIAKYTPLRQLAPNWESWDRGRKFPMGFSLGSTLVIYLALGVVYGA